MWYHADYVKPDWRNDFQRGPKIGRHVFYAIDSMKRRQTVAVQPALQYVALVPVAFEMTDAKPLKRFEISRDDSTERMLMIFGIGLIGLGFAEFRCKSS